MIENKEAEISIKDLVTKEQETQKKPEALQDIQEQQTPPEKPKEEIKNIEAEKREIPKPRKTSPKINIINEINSLLYSTKINITKKKKIKM